MSSRPRARMLGAVSAVVLAMLPVVAAGPGANAIPAGPGVTASRLPVPADALESGDPSIAAVSCGAPGFCVAVGTYHVTSVIGTTNAGLIETLSGGTWTAQRFPVPADGLTPGIGGLSGVACFGTATCAAYGLYATSPSTTAHMALLLTGGVWKAEAIGAPGGGTLSVSNPAPITGVGCTGVDACALVGNYYNASNQLRGWTSVYHAGHWGGALVTPTPNDATAQESHLNGMACGGGLCQAVGNYTNSVGWEPLVVSIDPVADTVNSPSSHPNVPAGAVMINDLTGIACDSGGDCAAYGSFPTSGGSNTEAMVFPVGGTAFQAQQPPTATAQSTTIFPAATVYTASCVAGSCMVGGYYYDTASAYHPLLDRFGASGWVADTAPNIHVPELSACGAAGFCLAVDNTEHGVPIDVLSGGNWVGTPLVLPGDADPSAVSTAYQQATACDTSTSCWVLGTYSAASGLSSVAAAYAAHVTPTAPTPPSVSVTSAPPSFTLSASGHLGWHGAPGSAPIAHYAVQVRRAPWNGGFGAWSTPSGWGALSAATSGVTVPLPVGDDTCVRVQAVDTASQHSAWTSPRCTTRPIDDRALTASTGWVRAKHSGYYLGTYTVTSHLGASLTRTGAQFDQLALVATKCPSCGKVRIYSGSTLLATINLYRASTARETLIVLPRVSLRSATVRLRVLTAGKSVQIDGLGVSRT